LRIGPVSPKPVMATVTAFGRRASMEARRMPERVGPARREVVEDDVGGGQQPRQDRFAAGRP
jgi:hypothetical protein